MYYDDSSKRRNLLTGLVFGTLLGAGIALLLAPGDGVAERARYVARSARGLRRSGRRTRAYARALHASVGDAVDAARASADGDVEDDGLRDDADDYAEEPERPVGRMARRRFTL
jgi:gas vesicle protein